MKPAPKFVIPGNSKDKFGKETLQDYLFMDNLEVLLATTLDKVFGNASGTIFLRFIKPRA